MKSRVIAAVSVILVVFLGLEAWLKVLGVDVAINATLKGWGMSHETTLYLMPVALACIFAGRVIAGRWGVALDFTLAAVVASWCVPFNIGTAIFIGLFGYMFVKSAARLLRDDYGYSRFWAITMVVTLFAAVVADLVATVPINKISIAIIGVAAIVAVGCLQSLFALEVQPGKKYPSEIE
jgi:hypothetical protein